MFYIQFLIDMCQLDKCQMKLIYTMFQVQIALENVNALTTVYTKTETCYTYTRAGKLLISYSSKRAEVCSRHMPMLIYFSDETTVQNYN